MVEKIKAAISRNAAAAAAVNAARETAMEKDAKNAGGAIEA
jgi:hypothetical protein